MTQYSLLSTQYFLQLRCLSPSTRVNPISGAEADSDIGHLVPQPFARKRGGLLLRCHY